MLAPDFTAEVEYYMASRQVLTAMQFCALGDGHVSLALASMLAGFEVARMNETVFYLCEYCIGKYSLPRYHAHYFN
jgi:hypothetical protein